MAADDKALLVGRLGVALARTHHIPERTCAACGLKLPKQDLIRIVRTPQGEIKADPSGKGPGRGAYLCRNPQCWRQGVYKGALQRGLRTSLSTQDQERLMSFHRQQDAGPSSMEK